MKNGWKSELMSASRMMKIQSKSGLMSVPRMKKV